MEITYTKIESPNCFLLQHQEEISCLYEELTSSPPKIDERFINYLAYLIHMGSCSVFFALLDEKIIGMVTLYRKMTIPFREGKNSHEIHGLIVGKEYRGQRIGKRLMEIALGACERPAQIDLTSKPERGKQGFYEKFGFKRIASATPGEEEDGTDFYRLYLK